MVCKEMLSLLNEFGLGFGNPVFPMNKLPADEIVIGPLAPFSVTRL